MKTENKNAIYGIENPDTSDRRQGMNIYRQLGNIGGVVLFLAIIAGSLTASWAGNGGYFVAYNHHIEKGEKEIMLMSDFTRPSKANKEEGQKDYYSQMLELEWAVTDKLATELMFEGFEEAGGPKKFTGFRWENRYRLFKDEVPLNPMIYMEYEHLSHETRFKMETSGWVRPPYTEKEETGEPKDERIMETRFVLSQDFGSTNVAFNWLNETDMRNSKTDFGYILAVMHNFVRGGQHHSHGGGSQENNSGGGRSGGLRLAAVGAEFWGGLGDDRKLDLRPSRQQHYFGPIVMFHMGQKWMLHVSPTFGLSGVSDNLLRIALGFAL